MEPLLQRFDHASLSPPLRTWIDHIAGGAFDCSIDAHRTSSIAKSVLLFVPVPYEQQT
jgi:hypothetical protein